MRRYLALILGVLLLGFIATQADLAEVWAAMSGLGLAGAGMVLAIFAVSFGIDSASWQLMLPSARLDAVWLARVIKVRLVGEAFNLIVPAGSLGGEPVKAWLLKRLHGIGYREAAASLIMAKTVNLLALIAFCTFGLALIWRDPRLSETFRMTAAAGLAVLALGVFGFYGVQRGRAASRLARLFARWRPGTFSRTYPRYRRAFRRLLRRPARPFRPFPRPRPGELDRQYGGALRHTMAPGPADNLGRGLGHRDRRAAGAGRTFFIPGSLGASEAVMVVIFDALSGRPALGLGWLYSLTPAKIPELTAKTGDEGRGGL